jgi:hypothetical protein
MGKFGGDEVRCNDWNAIHERLVLTEPIINLVVASMSQV